MLKINQFYWKLYKESPEGKKAIEKFDNAAKASFTTDEAISLFKEYDPEWFLNLSLGDTKAALQKVSSIVNNWRFDRTKSSRINAEELLTSNYGDFKDAISEVGPLSFYFFKQDPSYFIPYLFLLRYRYLRQILEDYDLDIVEVPGKANIVKRCYYYFDICDALAKFRDFNGLTPSELCAFLYDMERKRYDAAYSKESTPFMQVWLIGGKKEDKETTATTMCWQANEETKKGDILLFYETGDTETENKSCLTGIWRAKTDGITDPLFLRYGSVIIGDEIKIKPIPYKTLNSKEWEKKLPRCGAGFMGIGGDAVNPDVYKWTLDYIEKNDPSFNRHLLPELPEPSHAVVSFEDAKRMKLCKNPEEWVEECIIKVFLEEKMGLIYKKDYDRQVHLQMGRAKIEGEKTQDGRTDFSLFPFGRQNKCADVLIETKALGEMEGRDIEVAFWQAESYASRQYAGLIILADAKKVLLFPRKDGVFSYSIRKAEDTYMWDDIFSDANIQAELKKRILEYRIHSK